MVDSFISYYSNPRCCFNSSYYCWYLQRSKVPVVKAKIGPKVMTLMADPKVYDQIPIKAEVKAEVSGIYITGIKSVRGGKIVVEEKKAKKGLFKKLKKN